MTDLVVNAALITKKVSTKMFSAEIIEAVFVFMNSCMTCLLRNGLNSRKKYVWSSMMPRIEMTRRPWRHLMSFVERSKFNSDVPLAYNENALSTSLLFPCLRDLTSNTVHRIATVVRDKSTQLNSHRISEIWLMNLLFFAFHDKWTSLVFFVIIFCHLRECYKIDKSTVQFVLITWAVHLLVVAYWWVQF